MNVNLPLILRLQLSEKQKAPAVTREGYAYIVIKEGLDKWYQLTRRLPCRAQISRSNVLFELLTPNQDTAYIVWILCL